MLYDPINIELSEPLSYRASGEEPKSSNILVCSPPTVKDGKVTAYLKQHFWRNMKSLQPKDINAAVNAQDNMSPAEDENITAAAIITCLYMGNIDIYEYQMQFKKLICGNTGVSALVKIADEVPLTRTHYEKLDHEDVDLFMSEYLAFFLVNSLMKTAKAGSQK